jgi:hypothetical protein
VSYQKTVPARTSPATRVMLPPMRLSAAVLVLAFGCQSGSAAPKIAAGTPLAVDLATICHAVERSGAAKLEPVDQMYTMAQWLPANVSTEGQAWMVTWAKLGDDKAARRRMLERDSRAAGVLDCPLLVMWD